MQGTQNFRMDEGSSGQKGKKKERKYLVSYAQNKDAQRDFQVHTR